MYVFNPRGDICSILKILKEGKVIVVKCLDPSGLVLVVKHSRHYHKELSIYRKLKCMRIYEGYTISLNGQVYPVIGMEELAPLSDNENLTLLGCQVIDQLKPLHRFCVHSGIKPDNILKRRTDYGVEYVLMDFGSVSDIESKQKGWYYRRSWPVGFSSQKRKEKNQVTNKYHDFVELGNTLMQLSSNKSEYMKMKKFRDMALNERSSHELKEYLKSLYTL